MNRRDSRRRGAVATHASLMAFGLMMGTAFWVLSSYFSYSMLSAISTTSTTDHDHSLVSQLNQQHGGSQVWPGGNGNNKNLASASAPSSSSSPGGNGNKNFDSASSSSSSHGGNIRGNGNNFDSAASSPSSPGGNANNFDSPPPPHLEASIWTTRKMWLKTNYDLTTEGDDVDDMRYSIQQKILSKLKDSETRRLQELCGKFLYSSILKGAIVMKPDGTTFVATGDIDDMWTRDSSVQISLYYNRQPKIPYNYKQKQNGGGERGAGSTYETTNFRAILEGTLRRNAFYIVQDPYANAYEIEYKDPLNAWPDLKDRVIGRGGWVATRNYELDSGAYFLNQLWDYYVMDSKAATKVYDRDGYVLDAVRVLVDLWTIEQNHDENSNYRYFELSSDGLGTPTKYTGMTWTGFRPSDEACVYHYLVPANIHAAAGVERVLQLNQKIWNDAKLHKKATKLLKGISDGIEKFGIVKADDDGSLIYAYEVDGMGHALKDYDDANVPSLLSIPLLGWSGYDRKIYQNTRNRLLSSKNQFYYEGGEVSGIGSSHTNRDMVWPMAIAIQALTSNNPEEIVKKLRELIKVASCSNAMHESVHKDRGCRTNSRKWFEWANALFVILVEASLGQSCDAVGQEMVRQQLAPESTKGHKFYSNKHNNDPSNLLNYQGVQAFVKYE